MVPFLNGGLFECLDKDTPDSNGKIMYSDGFSRKKGRQSRAYIPNILFFDGSKGIISILNKYNFTIEENSPLDIEVALDPELLGKVFENLLGTYNPETKETARKQSGSFYTPREIVQYMVDESLVAHLKRTVGDELEGEYCKLINHTDEPVALTEQQKSDIFKSLKACKILDPACGSGAFPMGILNRMLAVITKLPIPENISLYDLKLYLIENCIYGIDIQSIAVQISKLRFFISLICEQQPNGDSADNYGIKPLPNLETKFVAANTLIGLTPKKAQLNLFEDPQIDVTRNELMQIRHKHFLASTSKQKKECRDEDKKLREKLAKLLDNNGNFAPDDARQLADWNPYDQNTSSPFFDTEWMFGIKDGFDVVIGNPPYGIIFDKKLKEVYEKNFHTFKRNTDIYVAFFEDSISLLRQNGILSFITPNTFMNGEYFKTLRLLFREKFRIREIVDFKNSKIFQDPTVFVAITILQKNNKPDLPYKSSINLSNENFTKTNQISLLISEYNDKPFKPFNKIINRVFLNKDSFFILDERFFVKDVGFNYWSIGKGKKRDGNSIGDRILYSGKKKDNNDKSFLKGKDIERYLFNAPNNYLRHDFEEYLDSGVDIFRYSANFLEISPKIIYRQTANKIIATIDFDRNLCDKTVHIITPKIANEPIKFLLPLLNSKLFDYFYKDISQELEGRTFAQVKTVYIKQLPIIKTNISNQQQLITLVDRILAAKQADLKADTSALEREIDRLVYELYGLTEEEIKIVEGK
jgi:tRNA1(Val) A37 N6-methylase TrmN6